MTNNADLKPSLIDLEPDNTGTGGKHESTDLVQPERLSEKDNMYVVYWIRLDKHNDIFTEGYVGITKNYKERLRSHKKSKNKYHVNNAIQKYGWKNLIKEVIHENITLEEALKLEFKYRSIQNIGWNNQIGGQLGVESSWYDNPNNKELHSKRTSEATKKGIAKNDTKEARSKRAKQSRLDNSNSYKNINLGSKNPKARLNEKQVKEIKFKLIPNGKSNKEISKMFNVKPYVIGFIRKNKTWKHIICDSPDHK